MLETFFAAISDGFLVTVEATIGGIILATILAFIAGLAMLSRVTVVRVIARLYVEIWRGTSELVQLFWIFFVLPILVGYELVPLWAGIVVLGANFGAYGAEIVRGAIQSVPKPQYEGCVALSLTPGQRMRRVIIPQALPEMVPPFNNLFIQLLKGSALLSLVFVHDILYQAMEVVIPSFQSQVLAIFLLVLAVYLVLSIIITIGMRWLERFAAASVGRRPVAQKKLHSASHASSGTGLV